jgi:hypothetical protein
MRRVKSPYEFQQSQVFTPDEVVALIWRIVAHHRPDPLAVIDLGAGDGRFAQQGKYKKYLGIEIDTTTAKRKLPANARLEYGCAFAKAKGKWDIAIGNPPYVRNHYIELPWMMTVAQRFKDKLDVEMNRQANLFVYFLLLGLDVTHATGLVAMLTPYEWVARPSSKPLRKLIAKNKWEVSIYRFKNRIFNDVMTTAALSIIDKDKRTEKWNFFEIDNNFCIQARRLASGSKYKVLSYERRSNESWALRGLSPGTQKVFTLTEGERIHHGLSMDDVMPCVTTLKGLDRQAEALTKRIFDKHFRDAGEKCWLIKSHNKKLSHALASYLKSVPKSAYQTSTCLERDPWYEFKPFPEADILVASGFTHFGPKAVRNIIGAHHVGSVYGVFAPKQDHADLVAKLKLYNFENRVIAHSGKLKKIEIRQLNGVLRGMCDESDN